MYIIAGYLKGRRIMQPPLLSTRPTSARVRECIFNIINHQLGLQNANYESLSVLDVFAGSGALGFEALSRGCHKLTLIDNHIDAVNVLYANADHLNVKDKVKIWRLNPLNLKASRDPYSLIFIDPPYGQNLIAKTLQVLSAHHWIANNAMIISEWGADESEKYETFLMSHNYQLTTLATRSFNHCTINVSRYNKLD